MGQPPVGRAARAMTCIMAERPRVRDPAAMNRPAGAPEAAITGDTTVDEILTLRPDVSALLVDLGLDTCCGGGSPLREACVDAQLSLDDVLDALTGPQPA